MKKSILFLLFILTIGVFPAWALAGVGVATDVQGSVFLTRDHRLFQLEKGVEMEAKDAVQTSADSYVQLDMDDGSILSMGSNSTMRLSDYVLREDKSVSSAVVNLISGWMRFAVSKLKRQNSSYRFAMATAVMGVRGTEGILNVDGTGEHAISSLLLKSGKVVMAEQLKNGTLQGPAVTLLAGEFASRKAGQALKKQAAPPASFTRRIPPTLQHALKPGDTGARGVRPRPIIEQGPGRADMRQGGKARRPGLTMLPGATGTSSENALFKVFNKGEKPRVKAQLSYTGSGMLRGVWEIALPSSTAGTPAFYQQTYVQRFLSQLGKVTIKSPRLPANMTGLYMVRFRITDPQPSFNTPTPVIRYFINARKQARKPTPLDLIAPAHGSVISGKTKFSWQGLPGASAYLLEIFNPAAANPGQPAENTTEKGVSSLLVPEGGISGRPPVAGMVIPAKANQTTLSQLARTHLKTGRRYLWRVQAIAASGGIIGESPLRSIRMP